MDTKLTLLSFLSLILLSIGLIFNIDYLLKFGAGFATCSILLIIYEAIEEDIYYSKQFVLQKTNEEVKKDE